MPIAQTLLPEFDYEMAGCRKELERVPSDRFDFKPHPKSFSLKDLANHLASMPRWVVGTLTTTEMDFSNPETMASMPKPVSTREALLERFDKGVAEARATLSGTPDADLSVIWTGRDADKVVFSMPRIAVYRTFIMNHLIHHRAQLGLYLRLLDQPVPALYGPSADETGA